jgi:hypothetical protein
VTALAENCPSTNGPVPTGEVSVYVAGVATLDQMCCGRIEVCVPSVPYRIEIASGVSGFENAKTTVFGPLATTDLSGLVQMPLMSIEGFAFR